MGLRDSFRSKRDIVGEIAGDIAFDYAWEQNEIHSDGEGGTTNDFSQSFELMYESASKVLGKESKRDLINRLRSE